MNETRDSSLSGKITVLVVICCCSFSAQAKYGGGTGEPNDPYLIFDANQMNAIGADANDWDKCFKLMADVDLSGYTGEEFNIIGNDLYNPFRGVFDGNGHTISNFNYTSTGTNYIGLFGHVSGENAEIKNLGLIDPNVDAGTGGRVGSLVGYNKGTITGCYVEGGSVSGDYRVGGLVGYNWRGAITNCYSTGSVSGNVLVGGLVGSNGEDATISNCYSTGSVSGTTDVGGLAGYNDGTVLISFWDIETSGQASSAGGTGKTTDQMKDLNTFLYWGACGNEGVWTIDDGNDYPHLWWENMPGELITTPSYGGGSGEPNDPYLIYTAEQLNMIGLLQCDWDKHFKLKADIDLRNFTGTSFNIIGSREKKFTGVFDGNRHTISNFTYTSSGRSSTGLFGEVGGHAEIRDLGLQDPNVDAGTGSLVGSLVGQLWSYAKITACYTQGGSVAGSDYIGGLVGVNLSDIKYCYSDVSVSGSYAVGGFVGYAYSGRIFQCYSTGSVPSCGTCGGFAGLGGNVVDSFWEIGTSGQTTSAGGTGKTTAEMYDPNTFMEAGWDFVSEADGPHDIWAEPAGGGYPILWWELSPMVGMPCFSGGTGDSNNPYLISTADELDRIGYNPRLMHSHFKLTNDINLLGVDFYIIGGSELYPFAGVFDGDHFVIWNFTHTSADRKNVGLFGYIDDPSAEVKNLGLDLPYVVGGSEYYVGALAGHLIRGTISNSYVQNCIVSGSGRYIGGLVGFNEGILATCGTYARISRYGYYCGDYVGCLTGLNNGIITDCFAVGNVVGDFQVGGLVGQNNNIITHCYSVSNVEAFNSGGGLVGRNNGSIVDCRSTSSVRRGTYLGGLVGSNTAEIYNCFSEGSVTSYVIDNYVDLGGLAGYNSGTISRSCTAASVFATESARQVGGLLGVNTGQVTNCYSLGDVEAGNYLGGLIGVNAGPISNCYSAGTVTALTVNDAGGLLGYNNGMITASFWNVDTSTQTQMCGIQDTSGTGCDAGNGKTTIQMQTGSTFTDFDWDFVDIWDICEGTNYPRFVRQIPMGDFVCPDGVEMRDFAILGAQWRQPPGEPSADIAPDGGDGIVDRLDLAALADNWLEGL